MGGGTIVGTGAFSQVSAQRSVTVETTGDGEANLGIEPFEISDGTSSNASQYVNAPENGTVSLNIEKVNQNAVTTIDRLLQITNNGTQTIQVGFNNQYAEEQGDYEIDKYGYTTEGPPGGWGYAVDSEENAAVVMWASQHPRNMSGESVESVRPELDDKSGFNDSTLINESVKKEIYKKRYEKSIRTSKSTSVLLLILAIIHWIRSPKK